MISPFEKRKSNQIVHNQSKQGNSNRVNRANESRMERFGEFGLGFGSDPFKEFHELSKKMMGGMDERFGSIFNGFDRNIDKMFEDFDCTSILK